ncbi:choice-of-anchor M domain-containing protein [Nesterenkonia alba]|uniref:choice-of-anchor M domain-containing protein n=1 Tax=Nesterenkonia alba TaxID=515814 RepID=UPI00146CD199|nr:choice-of-anchor M domain-containing protein [Nesterenkonia alba]
MTQQHLTTGPPRGRSRGAVVTFLAAVLALLVSSCGAGVQTEVTTAPTPEAEPASDGYYIQDLGTSTLGPAFDRNAWRLLLHETGETEDASTWRYPSRTALEAGPEAELRVPDNELYSFLDAEPGDHVWVLSETEGGDTPALSFSVQSPEAHSSIDTAVTFLLTAVEGPGTLTTYTQSAESDPEPLWDSREAFPQSMGLEVGGETSVNWVFTKPGVYHAQLAVRAELLDGSEFSDTQVISFSVGDNPNGERALRTQWDGPAAASYFHAAEGDTADPGRDWIDITLLASAIGLALILLTVLMTVTLRTLRRGRRPAQPPTEEREYDHTI